MYNIILLLSVVSSYYKQGHSLIGELTDKLLDKNIKNKIGISIKKISPWADSVRRNPSYRWANPLHFINTGDNAEENNCFVNSFNDTTNLYTSLTNYTERLSNKETRTEEDLKFFVHFYQDLYQPLHMSGMYNGGNSLKLNFFGRKTNLHQTWDYLILRNRIKEMGKKKKYLKHLMSLSKIVVPYKSFDFKFWIIHNNKLNCNNVYKDLDYNVTEEYYETNKYIIEYLITVNAVNLKYILEDLYSI